MMGARHGAFDLPNLFTIPQSPATSTTTLAYSFLSIALVYYLLQHLDGLYPSIPQLAWKTLVYLTPSQVVSVLDRSPEMVSETKSNQVTSYVAKSEAMRRILGLNNMGVLGHIQRARTFSGIANVFKSSSGVTLPGLGNWDNSCYQNSVLQGLAALPSFSAFLDQSISGKDEQKPTGEALRDLIRKLNDPANSGLRLWTPVELKNMSSWQQQDAQEYFSKVLDEVERETSKYAIQTPSPTGLGEAVSTILSRSDGRLEACKIVQKTEHKKEKQKECAQRHQSPKSQVSNELSLNLVRNPLEGLLAQRVGCMQCGFVEGLSSIPFNCLTVPLGKQWTYSIKSCLDDYTALEPIHGVECANCTLIHHKKNLQRLLHHPCEERTSEPDIVVSQISDVVRQSAESRLAAVNEVLESKDFSENALLKKCQIPAKSRILTTKSRQAVIARAPQALVIHINRSVFDEYTGMQSKNYADVKFPERLDLAPWCLGSCSRSGQEERGIEEWNTDPLESMLYDNQSKPSEEVPGHGSYEYELQATITHYGRHENGHYMCYRKNPHSIKHPGESADQVRLGERWWRLSDDEVSEVDEANVLAQGGVFMLFYQRIERAQGPATPTSALASKAMPTDVVSNKKTIVNEPPTSSIQFAPDHSQETAKAPIPIPPYPMALAATPATPSSHVLETTKSPSNELSYPSPRELKVGTPDNPRNADPTPPEAPSHGLSEMKSDPEISHNTDLPESPPSKIEAQTGNYLVPPPMRTAGPLNQRDAVSGPAKGMEAVSSMVTAN